jgi:ribonuclease HI
MIDTNPLILCTDGGARGNPGPAAIAYAIFDSTGNLLEENGRYLGERTNNEAEYEALLWGLDKVMERSCANIRIILDSQLVVKQTKGEYKTRDARMEKYARLVQRSLGMLESFQMQHARRTDPKIGRVDAIVNRVLDERGHPRK